MCSPAKKICQPSRIGVARGCWLLSPALFTFSAASFSSTWSASSCGIYGVPCSCGEVYISSTKHSVCILIGEHSRYCHWSLCFLRGNQDSVLVSGYYPWLHLEPVGIYKHDSTAMNWRGESVLLNRIWHAVLLSQSGGTQAYIVMAKSLKKGSFSELKTWFASVLKF